MSLRLIDPALATDPDWPPGSQPLRAYLQAFARAGSAPLIANLNTRVMALVDDDLALPVTINDAQYDNSYVCSPYTAYALYAKEEMRLLPGSLLRRLLRRVADAAGAALRAARINQIIHVNNWMLSTNLYPGHRPIPIAAATALLTQRFPGHYICFRSLNAWDNSSLQSQFAQARFKLVASRQVYVYENLAHTWLHRANARHDRRLLRHSPYRIAAGDDLGESDYPRMAELYDMLYLRKYSQYNPAFTSAFMRLCHRNAIMRFLGLRDSVGRLDGILGLFTIDGTVTAPIVGYDTSRDQRLGLYRLLMTLVFQTAQADGHAVNLSSGAAHFKRLRGGRPVIEYSAIYDRHLPPRRRLAVSALALAANAVGVPIMRSLKL